GPAERPPRRRGGHWGECGDPAVGVTVHAVPRRPPVGFGPGRLDHAHPLMPGIERVLTVADADRVLARVSRAYPAGLDADQELTRPGPGYRQLLKLQVLDAVQPGSAHQVLPQHSLLRDQSM